MASQRKQDKKKLDAYLARLEIAQKATSVDPFEARDAQQRRIARAQDDIEYMVETYLPHYASAKCADFQIDFANDVAGDPLFKGFAEWGRGWQNPCGATSSSRCIDGCAGRTYSSA